VDGAQLEFSKISVYPVASKCTCSFQVQVDLFFIIQIEQVNKHYQMFAESYNQTINILSSYSINVFIPDPVLGVSNKFQFSTSVNSLLIKTSIEGRLFQVLKFPVISAFLGIQVFTKVIPFILSSQNLKNSV
jgi:hypothetical protein